jgi:sRNA-binding carbon storage regulator CsrA
MALVLNRKVGQAIIIEIAGEQLVIEVNEINERHQQVKLLFTGSKNFSIDRDEIHFQKHRDRGTRHSEQAR